MKRILLILLSACFSLNLSAEIKKIVIDPGHGGTDYGCNGSFAYEKDINLAIALKLGDLIKKYMPGTTVLYTRKEDINLDLCDRAVAANVVAADLFISIHCNAAASNENTLARGVEVYIQDINLTPEQIAAAKKQVPYSEFEEPESLNCPPNNFTASKMLLAAKIALGITNNLALQGLENKGVKKANFMVLRKTTMPSVLVECGFLTNPDEEKFLASEKGQLIVASCILKSIIKANL